MHSTGGLNCGREQKINLSSKERECVTRSDVSTNFILTSQIPWLQRYLTCLNLRSITPVQQHNEDDQTSYEKEYRYGEYSTF